MMASKPSPSKTQHEENAMIIVTGANGQLGRAIVQKLVQRVPVSQVGASVRDPEKASDLAALGVRVRRGDFDDPASLADAFEGATQVLIVSVNSFGEAAAEQHRVAINTAKAAGAQRIVYTSHMAESVRTMGGHADTEAALQECGVAYTALRNGYYATSARWLLGDALATGDLAAPEDGPIAYTAHPDLAAAAAIALTGEEFDGVTPALTGPEALDLAGVAALASEISGHPIRRVMVPEAEYRAAQITKGVPEPMVDILLGFFAASRQGQFAPADPTLARLLGRPAMPLWDVLKAALSPAG